MGRNRREGDSDRERELLDAYRRRHIRRYSSLLLHWMSRYVRRARRADVAPLPSVTPGQVGISYIGHASALVRYSTLDIACDPMLGRSIKGIRRESDPGLSPADLKDVDLILISNADPAHLHRKTLSKLPRSATIIVPSRTAQRVSDLGFARVVELGVGQGVQHRGVDITAAAIRLGGDERGLAYIIRGDGPSVYFCGASGYFSGFAAIGERYRPDVALLPIGGYSPSSFRDRHMTPLDALYAFEDLAARVMIPIRHGAFVFSKEHIDDPARWLAQVIRERELDPFVVELTPGQSRVFVPPQTKSETAVPEDAPTGDSIPVEFDDEDEPDDDAGEPVALGEEPEKPDEPELLAI